MEKDQITVRNQGRLRVWCLLMTDILALYGILTVVLCVYKQFGGDYSLAILADLWPLPAAVVVCNLFARVYCGSFLYPGGGCSPVDELRRLTLSVICGYGILFAYLSLFNALSQHGKAPASEVDVNTGGQGHLRRFLRTCGDTVASGKSIDAGKVGNDESVEFPGVAKDICQKELVGCGGYAVK